MDDTAITLLLARLERIENKVDQLMNFRAWLLGLGAAAGAMASVVLSWIRGQ